MARAAEMQGPELTFFSGKEGLEQESRKTPVQGKTRNRASRITGTGQLLHIEGDVANGNLLGTLCH